jgi:hypothetical protein
MSNIDSMGGERPLQQQQAGVIFGQIASLASCVERLGVLLVDQPEDGRDESAYQIAITAISNQIGLLADIGAKATGDVQLNGGDPIEWLLPPVFPR